MPPASPIITALRVVLPTTHDDHAAPVIAAPVTAASVTASQAGQQPGELLPQYLQRGGGRGPCPRQCVEGGSLQPRDQRPGVTLRLGRTARGQQPRGLGAEAPAHLVVGGPQLRPPSRLERELETRPHPPPRPVVGDHPVQHPSQPFGQLALGQPAPGHPAPGHPAPGHPAPGHPAPGHPAPGHPAPGYPTPRYSSSVQSGHAFRGVQLGDPGQGQGQQSLPGAGVVRGRAGREPGGLVDGAVREPARAVVGEHLDGGVTHLPGASARCCAHPAECSAISTTDVVSALQM
jgi:hypothetical protein